MLPRPEGFLDPIDLSFLPQILVDELATMSPQYPSIRAHHDIVPIFGSQSPSSRSSTSQPPISPHIADKLSSTSSPSTTASPTYGPAPIPTKSSNVPLNDFPCPSCHGPYPSHTPSCPPVHFFCKECFAPEPSPSSNRRRHHFSFCKLRQARHQKRRSSHSELNPTIPEWGGYTLRPRYLRGGDGVLGWDAEVYGDLTPVQRRLVREAEERKAQEDVELQEREVIVKGALSRSMSASSAQAPTALRWLVRRIRRSSSANASDG